MNAALWLLLLARGTSRTARYIDTDVDPETVLATDSRPSCFAGLSRSLAFAGDRDHVFAAPSRELALTSERHDLFAGANR